MKMKSYFIALLLGLNLLCACGSTGDAAVSDTEASNIADTTASGNFSEEIIIENPGTETVIVEMP